MATPAPAFSYAQAAKGRSTSQPSASAPSKPASEMSDSSAKATNTPKELEPANAAQIPVNGDSTADSRKGPDAGGTSQSKAEAGAKASTAVTGPGKAPQSSQTSDSIPPSPGLANGSISGSRKEEDTSATTNESESTWDKVSQNSQHEEKAGTKVEGDGDDSKLSTWVELPPVPQLKEAPPPSINVWQKRAADAKSKTHEGKPLGGQLPKTDASISGQKKVPEPLNDAGKPENRRKPSGSRQSTEEKVPSSKEVVKPSESKTRSGDEEKTTVKPAGRLPAAIKAPPPPPNDAVSWPTPDIAKEEDKKKPQERNEKPEQEKTPSKPHGKEKWVQMPYVPTAVFNTPLPQARRGGRPARGGREPSGGRGNHTVNGSISGGDRPQAGGSPSASVAPSAEKPKGDMGPPRPGPLAPRAKRASSAGPSTLREQRRNGDVPQAKTEELSQRPFPGARNTPTESRRTSSAQTDGLRQGSPPDRKQQPNEPDAGMKGNPMSHDHAHPRVFSGRSEGARTQEYSRDNAGMGQNRERGEGRSERGRGGYRGRGGHNGFGNGHGMNGQGYPMGPPGTPNAQGFMPSKSQSYTEQRHPQSQNATFTNSREPRHFRTGSRSQSIPNPNFARYSSNGAMPAGQQLPHLQTDTANLYYPQAQPGVMSAMPYPNYMEQMQLASMVQMQMEYYFSVDNLCKDMFLRKNMDSQGFVFLTVLQNFNRIRQLTSDLELIRMVCWRSPQIELLTGGDGIDRVRKAVDWQQWVLATEERVSSAQNDGPSQLQQPQLPMYGPPVEAPRLPVSSPRSSFTSSQFRPEPIVVNGHPTTGPLNDGQITQTPLSAAVPDFTPSLQSLNSQAFTPLDTSAAENTFSDDQIGSLMIVVKKPNPSGHASGAAPTMASRTLSNGSGDTTAINDETSGLNISGSSLFGNTNGDNAAESGLSEEVRMPRSPLTFGTLPRQLRVPPTFWVKDHASPDDDLANDLTSELYTEFRREALSQRTQIPKGQVDYDMEILYQFWSHFLVRNFNAGMYDEFRRFALEDATTRDSVSGLKHLITFYDESILGAKVISDTIARDYVELVKSESGNEERPAFDKLRAAWRNGAFPLRNRVKMDKMVDAELKLELES